MTKHVRRVLRMVPLAIGAAVLGAVSAPGNGVLAQGATVAISPPDATVACNQNITVSVMINNVTNLYGVDFKISYDPAIVGVVDADLGNPGTQIQPGTFPDVSGGQGLIQVNSVDVGTGVISYAATLINPSPAQTGSGPAVQITFRGIANGTTDVELFSVLLSDNLARPIQAVPNDGQITVTGCTGNDVPTPSPTARPTTTPIPGDDDDDDDDDDVDHKRCAHTVRAGETLYAIAARYGTTVLAIVGRNNLKNANFIYIGQKLIIPNCDGGVRPGPVPGPGRGPAPGDNCFPYTVRPGDTLYGIALANGDRQYQLAVRNGIVNPNLIRIGQRLSVCGPGGSIGPGPMKPPPGKFCRSTHVVKPGENLYRISLLYGTNFLTIAQVNNLVSPDVIYAGQVLCIP